jgi:hypothetical protein
LTAGAALFFIVVVLLFKFFTSISPSIVLGSELAIVSLLSTVRAFVGPVGAYPELRKAKLLLTLPVGLFALTAFANAWSSTSAYAPWIIAATFLSFFGITWPYIRKIRLKYSEQKK